MKSRFSLLILLALLLSLLIATFGEHSVVLEAGKAKSPVITGQSNVGVLQDADIDPSAVIDPQVQIDTIQRAFRRLPAPEIERLGVDIEGPIASGSERARQLLDAWKQRQGELKLAMQSMLKPAEHMGNLTMQLRSDTVSDQRRLQILVDLESLLADIDNAKDFHTIGSWPTLVAQLIRRPATTDAATEPHLLVDIQAAAAWAIGTAVKNSYDYQLWLLEDVSFAVDGASVTTTAWERLASLLDDYAASPLSFPAQERDSACDLQKRLLYALSAGLRGNLDVQGQAEPLVPILARLLSAPDAAPEVQRKVLSLVRDMLEERQYILQELMPNLSKVVHSSAPLSGSNETAEAQVSIDGTAVTAPQAEQALQGLQSTRMLGEAFLAPSWTKMVLEIGQRSATWLAEARGENLASKDRLVHQACVTNALHVLHTSIAQVGATMWEFREPCHQLAMAVMRLSGETVGEMQEVASQVLQAVAGR